MSLIDLLTNPWGADALDWARHLEWGYVPLRVTLGVIMFDSGRHKWMRGISGTGEWFRGLGFPMPQLLARFVATVEFVGGALLVVGLFTHLAALFIAGNMLVATYVQRFKLGAPFHGGDVQGYELDIILAASAIALFLGGAGPLSLDALWFQ